MTRVAIVIRSFNERALIGRCLAAVLAQEHPAFEIVVVDSGSTDGTPEIAAGFERVRLVRLAPADFTYGRALNFGIRHAAPGTQAIAMLSAHAIPMNPFWLSRLVAPLAADPAVAGAYGRQEPWPEHLGNRVVRYLARNGYKECYGDQSFVTTSARFFSNANAAIRHEDWQARPFDESLAYAEDWKWAQDAQRRGRSIAYVAEAGVWHSHPDSAAQFLGRRRREERGMVELEGPGARPEGLVGYGRRLVRSLRQHAGGLLRGGNTAQVCADALVAECLIATAVFLERRKLRRRGGPA